MNIQNLTRSYKKSKKIQKLHLKIFSKNQLYLTYGCINSKNISQSSISNQRPGNEFFYLSKDKILRKLYLKMRDSKTVQMKFQTNYKKTLYFKGKSNTKYIKYKIIGGGCRQSSIQVSNLRKINYSYKKGILDKKFIQNYEDFTDKKQISENIEYERQGAMQVDIVRCLQSSDIHIRRNIILYKPKLINLIDTYLIYVLTGSSQNEVLKQKEINEIGSTLQDMKKSFEMESRDQPSCDLIFYFDILYSINSARIGKDEQNKSQLIQVAQFMTTIIKLGSGILSSLGGNFKESIDLVIQGVQFLLKQYQTQKKNKLFSYFLDIWVKKTDQFQDKIWNLTFLQEIQFYIKIFNEISSKKDYETDFVLLTLIKIDYYFSLAIEDQDNIKTLSKELSLNSELMKTFIPMLIQKSDSQSIFDEMKSFLQFTVQNHTYRFLTISTLLKYNKIIQNINDSQNYNEQIMEYLCYKYLSEKNKSVKLAFETSKEFVDHFNSKISQKQFQDKIILLSNQRRNILQILDLEKYEEKIENLHDIERMIANTIIDKWERDVKRRQQDNIIQKDDVLLEVKDLYIQQSITYLEGNKFIQQNPSLTQINKKNQAHQKQNALQEILVNFLSGMTKENQNVNISNTEEKNRCKILGILAEGGTGKSMLLKKLETYLIDNSDIENWNNEGVEYIPLLIKCNSLDPVEPSINQYLQAQGIEQKKIDIIKKSERNKVILLDGYDEYTGKYFRVHSELKLKEWKNTKVIVTTRREKLTLNEACFNFSLDNEKGQIDDSSFSLMKLEEFNKQDIFDYCERYFKQRRINKDQDQNEQQVNKDMKCIEDCMKNQQLENLLYLPINLYLFTRMMIDIESESEIQQIKLNISDQVGIQEIFFKEQFNREALDFVQQNQIGTQLNNQRILELISNCYFEYFQTVAMMMFLNKGKKGIINFLQLQQDQIHFSLRKHTKIEISKDQQDNLINKIINYVNSKIITRVKDLNLNTNGYLESQSQIIEFRHKSLFEYFVARAMKYDYDIHKNNICKISMKELKEFSINQKTLMNTGQNQSEQQILLKLYKLIKNEIESIEFQLNYYDDKIEKNNRFIQYLKRSTISKQDETSQIDIGASNLLSALFISKFSYPKLSLSLCSFSKAYISNPKSSDINFDRCNFNHANLQNSNINYDSCNTQQANFDAFSKVFDTQNIYSFNKVIWGKNNDLYSISNSGFINSFKIIQSKIQLKNSKQLSQTPLFKILKINDETFLVSSEYSIFLINQNNFEIKESHKFKDSIESITMMKESIFVTLKNHNSFHGSFKDGFKQLKITGQESAYNQAANILITCQSDSFQIWDLKKNFELIKTIQSHTKTISSVAFSSDGKYLATGSEDSTCKIWNAEKDFELINTIQNQTSQILSIAFSADGQYLATGSGDQFSGTCYIWSIEKDFKLQSTIQGHTKAIVSVAFSVDGKYLATSSSDNTCKVWSAQKGFEIVNTIQGHSLNINSVVFSRDGKFLATGSSDNTCKIWNTEKCFELINIIQGNTEIINSVVFSTDGKYLATGLSNNTFKIWSTQKDFELINTIQGHSKIIFSVAFSSDGKFLASGSKDKTCKIWNVEKGFELINTIQGHGKAIFCVAFSEDGVNLVTGSKDKTCKIWNTQKNFELINTIQGHTSFVNSVAYSANGEYLATGSGDKTCKIWNALKGFELIRTIQGHAKTIYSVTFSSDGKYLATGSSDKTCKIWNAEKGFELINTIQGHSSLVKSIAFSTDRKYLATGSSDNTCKIWNAEKGFEFINTIQGHDSCVRFATFSADAKYLATGSEDNTCKIWNAEKGFDLLNTIQDHTSWVRTAAFSPDGKYLATGSDDNTCKIWNAEKGFELINTFQGHSQAIFSVAFSADGKYLVTGSKDKTCKIRNVEKGFETINTISGHTSFINSVAFSTDGNYLATGSSDSTCKIWNAEKGFELVNTIQDHTEQINSVTFSLDGKYLATGSQDSTCKIWNVKKGFENINSILGHTSSLNSVAFSADSKYLITGSSDNTCKIWNVVKNFQLINTFQYHLKTIFSVAFSQNGKYLATGSQDNTCKIWNAQKGIQLINTIQGDIDQEQSVAFSSDEKYFCVKQKDHMYNIYDMQNFEIIKEQNKKNQLEKQYQFEFNENNKFEKIKIFDNIYIL